MKLQNQSNNTTTVKYHNQLITVQPGEIVELPEAYIKMNNGLYSVSQKSKKDLVKEINNDSKLTRSVLEKMTVDELNDLAAMNGFGKEIKSSMKKLSIINKILKLLG